MFHHCLRCRFTFVVTFCAQLSAAEPDQRHAELEKQLAPFYEPPAEFAGKFGSYRSPLKFADGSAVKTPEDWTRRRAEILQAVARAAGAWPPLVEKPTVKRLETVERDGYTEITSTCRSRRRARWPMAIC